MLEYVKPTSIAVSLQFYSNFCYQYLSLITVWLKVRFYGFLVPFSNNKDFSPVIILHQGRLTR